MFKLYTTFTFSQMLFFMIMSLVVYCSQLVYVIEIRNKRRGLIFELNILIYIVYLGLVWRKVTMYLEWSYIKIWPFDLYMNIIFFTILINALIFQNKKSLKKTLPALLISLMPLTIWTRFYTIPYPVVFVTSLALYLARAIILLLEEREKNKDHLSINSFKEAFDLQKSGIVFFNEKGIISYVNIPMLIIMKKIKGKSINNAMDFYNSLLRLFKGKRKNTLDLDELGVWEFSLEKIFDKRQNFYEIIAFDVTDQDRKNKEVIGKNIALSQKNKDLKDFARKVKEVKKAQLAQETFRNIHDFMGQKVSVLERRLKENPDIDLEDLTQLVNEIREVDISAKSTDINEIFEEYRENLKDIGINLSREGDFPQDEDTAKALNMIAKEGIINAIRHGRAKNIHIKTRVQGKTYIFELTSDGKKTDKPLIWGGGIKMMSAYTSDLSGQLEIIESPHFPIIELKFSMRKYF